MTMIAIAHPRNRKQPVWVELQKILADNGVELSVYYSEWSGHSSELAEQHCPKEGTVLSVGGDGTFNEVLNGWMNQADRGSPHFVLVPLGTGNDFARDQGLKLDAMELAAAVLRPTLKTVDLAKVSFQTEEGERQRYFLVAATLGFSAEVVRLFQSMPRVLPGTAQYLLAMLVSLWRWHNVSASIETDQGTWESQNLFNFNIANARFYGGGMYASPRAQVDSGRLETVLMELGRFGVLKALPRNYNGKFEDVPGVRQQSATSIRVSSPAPIPVQADGEYLGTTPIEVEIVPQVMNLALPGRQAP